MTTSMIPWQTRFAKVEYPQDLNAKESYLSLGAESTAWMDISSLGRPTSVEKTAFLFLLVALSSTSRTERRVYVTPHT
jgi:hypothetical protein